MRLKRPGFLSLGTSQLERPRGNEAMPSRSIGRYTQSWVVFARLGVSSYPRTAPLPPQQCSNFSHLIIPSWRLVTCRFVTRHLGQRGYLHVSPPGRRIAAVFHPRLRCRFGSQVHLSVVYEIKSSVERSLIIFLRRNSINHAAEAMARN